MMPAVYTQSPTGGAASMPANPLTLREREEIRYGIGRGEKATEIADRLGRHRCTISAEISRNGGRDDYRAYRAHDRAKACRARPKAPLLERCPALAGHVACRLERSEEHTSELQSLMRISYAVFCLKKKKTNTQLK